MRKSLLALSVLGAFAGAASGFASNHTKPTMRNSFIDAFGRAISFGRKSAGVSMAQQKRNGMKKRNQKRNKALK